MVEKIIVWDSSNLHLLYYTLSNLITTARYFFFNLLHDVQNIDCKYSFWECKYTAIKQIHGSTDCTAVVSARWKGS